MDILPLKFLRDEDIPVVGASLVKLARLKHLDFPVADGVVVIPPIIHLKTVLKNYQFRDREIFEQSLELVRKDILKTPLPQDLTESVITKKISPEKLWQTLLDNWLSQIRSNIWREGFLNPTANLSAQPVFFTNKVTAAGIAYYDGETRKIVVKVESGDLSETLFQKLQQLVKIANQKLFLPFVYHWILDGELKFVKIVPFTQGEVLSGEEKVEELKTVIEESDKTKSAVKVFLRLSNQLRIEENIDGAIIENLDSKDFKMHQLVEAALSLDPEPVIYQLAANSLNLLHNQTLLKDEAETILFARNKKGLLNVQVAIPFVRSANEFSQLKRDLASLGLNRKGTLKLWLELAVPENLINIEKYLEIGFDGALLNLDQIAAHLGGYALNAQEAVLYKGQINTITEFIEPIFKKLHKAQLPILVTGGLSLHDDLLRFLMKAGIWGISLDAANMIGVKDQLSFIEKHHIKSLSF